MSSIDRVSINKIGIDQSTAVHGKDASKTADNKKAPSAEDSIELSFATKNMDRIAGLVQQSHDERLEQVRLMLASGTYHVSADDIAQKLIELNRS